MGFARIANSDVGKTVVITQSNYLPWRGYFDMIGSADELVLLDCVQFTRRDWRNRNVIKTPSGLKWLTIPVHSKGQYLQAIDETRVSEPNWADAHRQSITLNYKRAPHFEELSSWLFAEMRAVADEPMLSDINAHLIGVLCAKLEISVPIRRCTDILERTALVDMAPAERLIELCREVGATRYLSGPAAKSYLKADRFAEFGIEVAWMDYEGYPDYPQLWGPFEPKVSVIDLLLNTGEQASHYLKENAVVSAGDQI